MMTKHILALILLWLAMPSATADDISTAVFPQKFFDDLGNMVAVEGCPAEGANIDATKRWVVWCYQERRECLSFMIGIQGGVVQILPGIPVEYTIVVWAPDRILAEHQTRLCGRETWLLDRLRNTAEYFSGACGDKTTATHLTLEDPPDWTKLKERLEDPKRRR
jgi:hypothetical protein